MKDLSLLKGNEVMRVQRLLEASTSCANPMIPFNVISEFWLLLLSLANFSLKSRLCV